MSWKSGSSILEQIIPLIRDYVPNPKYRKNIYEKMIVIFEGHDCDTVYECLDIDEAFDDVYHSMYPEEDIE